VKISKNSHRRSARSRIVQALYQWQLSQPDADVKAIERMYLRDHVLGSHDDDSNDSELSLPSPFDKAYAQKLWKGIICHSDEIDAKLAELADRSIASLTPVEYAVLRLGIYELLYESDVPFRVVVNEALEITKCYGTEEGYKYVNAVLDKLNPG